MTLVGGSGSFDPTTVGSSTLKLYLSSLLVPDWWTDMHQVGQWDDYSGNNNHATQANVGMKPTYVRSAFNSRPAMLFAGSHGLRVDSLAASFTGSDLPGTMICCLQIINGTTAFQASYIDIDRDSASGPRFNLGFDGTPAHRFRRSDDTATGKNVSTATPIVVGSPLIITGVYDGTLGNMYLNGAQLGTANQNIDVGTMTLDVASIGHRRSNGAHSQWFEGYLAVALVYASALSTADRQYCERKLGQVFGISVA